MRYGQSGRCAAGITECALGQIECLQTNQPLANEICNGEDDNCNGVVDTDTPGYGDPCSEGLGLCKADGTRICDIPNRRLTCSAVPGPRGQEVCDGDDNDCDGAEDEGYPLNQMCTVGQGSVLAPVVWCVPRMDWVQSVPANKATLTSSGATGLTTTAMVPWTKATQKAEVHVIRVGPDDVRRAR